MSTQHFISSLMKKFCLVLCLLVFGIISIVSQLVSHKIKPKIAILDFVEVDEHLEKNIGKKVAEWLIASLVKTGRFELVERKLLEKILEEQKFQISGFVDIDTATKIGNIAGVKYIISGTIITERDFVEVNARVIDISTGLIIAAESVKAHDVHIEEIVKKKLSYLIANTFPIEGTVIKKIGREMIMIDIGKLQGISEGTHLSIFKKGDIIRHPSTGKIIDVEEIKIGQAIVKEVKSNVSMATIINQEEEIKIGTHVRVELRKCKKLVNLAKHIPTKILYGNSTSDYTKFPQNTFSEPPIVICTMVGYPTAEKISIYNLTKDGFNTVRSAPWSFNWIAVEAQNIYDKKNGNIKIFGGQSYGDYTIFPPNFFIEPPVVVATMVGEGSGESSSIYGITTRGFCTVRSKPWSFLWLAVQQNKEGIILSNNIKILSGVSGVDYVSFPNGFFSKPPIVVCSMLGQYTAEKISVYNISNTGFHTIRSRPWKYTWIAIGE